MSDPASDVPAQNQLTSTAQQRSTVQAAVAAATVSAKTSREADGDERDLTVAKRSDSFV